MVAINDQGRFARLRAQIAKRGRNGAHRNQFAALDASLRMLVRLADVNQVKLLSGIEASLDFLGSDFERDQNFFSSSTSPARPFFK